MLPALTESDVAMMSQPQRARLIGQIATVLRKADCPPEARQAGLTFIGWLARRMPHDAVDSRTLRRRCGTRV
jgi:hypothetical protein